MSPPSYSPECVEGLFSEVGLTLYGVLKSSLSASNSKQRQRYAVCGMRDAHPEGIMLGGRKG